MPAFAARASLVLLVLTAALAFSFTAACSSPSKPRSSTRSDKRWVVDKPAKPRARRHATHDHRHGDHPHRGGGHHHHPHPHPHLEGTGGHHHPY